MTQTDIKIDVSNNGPFGHPSQSRLIRTTAHNLARIMFERDLSVEEVADILGLCPVYLRDFLAVRRNMTVLTVTDICMKLDVSLLELVLPSPVSERN